MTLAVTVALNRKPTKAFAADPINFTEKFKLVQERVENIVGKGENAVLPAFSPFTTIFFKSRQFQFWVAKSDFCGKGLPFTKRQNLKPVQFESIFRRHFKCSSNDDLCY